jgi:hypothetical protein
MRPAQTAEAGEIRIGGIQDVVALHGDDGQAGIRTYWDMG